MKKVKHPDWEHKKTTRIKGGGWCKIGKTDLIFKRQECWRGKKAIVKSKSLWNRIEMNESRRRYNI